MKDHHKADIQENFVYKVVVFPMSSKQFLWLFLSHFLLKAHHVPGTELAILCFFPYFTV